MFIDTMCMVCVCACVCFSGVLLMMWVLFGFSFYFIFIRSNVEFVVVVIDRGCGVGPVYNRAKEPNMLYEYRSSRLHEEERATSNEKRLVLPRKFF